MARRVSTSDYPEHLNPFYEKDRGPFWKLSRFRKSGSFGESLRNTLTLKSFRGKKKDKRETSYSPPQIRKPISTTNPTLHRRTVPATLPLQTPEPLPRSRFSERVAKSPAASNGDIPNSGNPFEEAKTVPEHKLRRMRRRKRRAPLPPGMAREEGDNYMSSEHNLSKWSLTSFETDISTHSETVPEVDSEELSKIANHITKEMEELTEETIERSDVPDLIVSTERKTDDVSVEKESVVKEETVEESVVETVEKEYEVNGKETPTIDENSNLVRKSEAGSAVSIDKLNENCMQKDNSIENEEDELQSSQVDEENANSEDATVPENVNFTESTVYIKDSNENLENGDKVETVDINQNESSITPSPACTTDMTITVNVEETIQEDDTPNGSIKPVAKIRTNVPTKHELLGNETVENM